MADVFDPYYKWLGIPPKHQPPDHYRLLGLEQFESDPDVIDAAAAKQVAYLQGCATGPHVSLSQKLLNEVSAARLCLLNRANKAAYDAALKANGASDDANISGEPPQESGVGPKPSPATPELEWITPQSSRPAPKGSRRRKGPSALGIVVASVGGLFVAWAVFSWMRGNTEDVSRKEPREQASVHRQDKPSIPVNDDSKSDSHGSAMNVQKKSREKSATPPSKDETPVEPKSAASTETTPSDEKPAIEKSLWHEEEELNASSAAAKSKDDNQAVAEKGLALADRAIVEGDADMAKKAVLHSLVAARNADNADLTKRATQLLIQLQNPLTETLKDEARKRLGSGTPAANVPDEPHTMFNLEVKNAGSGTPAAIPADQPQGTGPGAAVIPEKPVSPPTAQPSRDSETKAKTPNHLPQVAT